jgi:predicted permease
MFKQHFAGMEWGSLSVFALCIFMAFFTLVVLRTFAFKTKRDFEPQGQLPLSDGKEIS